MLNLTAPQFTDADMAREYLEALRWANGVACPHCGSISEHYALKGKAHRPGLWKCKDCRKQFSVTVGTVFERSKIPLNKWLMAVHLMCASKKGISSHQIHRMLGVTYKSAWFMCHRIREAMDGDGGGLLGGNGGLVEVDETYWGTSKEKPKGTRGYDHKMKIVSLVEREGVKRTIQVPAVTAATLRPILKAQIDAKAHLMTDEASVYTKAGREFAEHGIVRHSAKEYARGDVTTNTVESSFSLLKRGPIGTFHYVGEQHLQRNSNEFDFRWNYRVKLGYSDADRANVALLGIADKRLMSRDSSAAA